MLFMELISQGLVQGSIYALVALGLTLVYGLLRGGIAVGAPIAEGLKAPLLPFVVRKLGVPWQPELGFGALAEGAAGPW